MNRCGAYLFLLFLSSTLLSTSAIAEKTCKFCTWIPSSTDLRILEVKTKSYLLDDVVTAYQYEDTLILPLRALSEILDLAVEVEPKFAQGFIVKEKNTFILDVENNIVILKGKPGNFDRSRVFDLEDDIYIEANLLGQWMQMKFNIDLFNSTLTIESENKLPFLQKIERQSLIKKSLARSEARSVVYPRHRENNKLWSIPFLDQSFDYRFQETSGNSSSTLLYTTYLAADFLNHTSNWYLTGNNSDALEDIRVTLGRKDQEASLLGPLNATSYSFGSTVEPRVDLINQPGSVTNGFTIDNHPLGQQIEYDRHRFRGELLPGWEAVLFQNNSIIRYQQAPIDGQYDFVDVPLLFGKNHFRIALYGPSGQVRETEEHFFLDRSLIQKNKNLYRFSLNNDVSGGRRMTYQHDYGLTNSLSTSLNILDIPTLKNTVETQSKYVKLSFKGFYRSTIFNIGSITDLDGGDAIDLKLNTNFDGNIVGFEHTIINNLITEELKTSGSSSLTSKSKLNFNSILNFSSLPSIPISFELNQDKFKDGSNRYDLLNTISTNLKGIAVSNQLRFFNGTNQTGTTTGTLQGSYNLEGIRLRGAASYSLNNSSTLDSITLSASPGSLYGHTMNFGYNYSTLSSQSDLTITANKLSKKFTMSYGARYSTSDQLSLDFRLSFGFGYEPRRDTWYSNAQSLANSGSISARVFIDNDTDGIYTENDEPLEHVRFRLNNGYNPIETEKDGIAFITGVQPYLATDVVIEPGSIEDPLLYSAIDGINITPRPGSPILLDFPMFTSGEVDGTVYLKKGDNTIGASNVIVELADKNGNVVRSTESSYDGFYVISKVPLGEYRLRISEKQKVALELYTIKDELVEVTSEEPFQSGFDITLHSYNSE